ncbi:MAG: glycosyltransferase, partial [Chloroflexi bacterium HGW-Chloroflexi-5]
MLITILAAGSTGDTIPYIALGKELKKAGDRVRFATFRNFENLIKNHGLEFHPIHGDIRQAAASTVGQEAMQADNPLKLLLSFNRLKDLAQGVQNDLFEACKGADLIIYHPGCAVGFFAAQQFGIPSV